MEHSTGAVNWQPRNIAKLPGEMRRNSLAHVARGADGVMFFQWRASRVGAEKFHSAMLPQGGTGTRIWREVTAARRRHGGLAGPPGQHGRARTWRWCGTGSRGGPSISSAGRAVDARAIWSQCPRTTRPFWRRASPSTSRHPTRDLSAYPLVVVPTLYLTTERQPPRTCTRYVEAGGHVVVSCFSGIVDEHDPVHPGAYPGVLRELLGLWVDEFHPLSHNETVRLDNGGLASVWSEMVVAEGAQVVRRFGTGPDTGAPALTRHLLGQGLAWYVATRPDEESLQAMLSTAAGAAGVVQSGTGGRVEVVRRWAADASYVFVINHEAHAVTVPFGGTDLLSHDSHLAETTVGPGQVVVLRQPA